MTRKSMHGRHIHAASQRPPFAKSGVRLRVGTARGARITPFGGTRPLRWRPGCRAAGGLDAVDDIVAIVKNAASPIRDDGDPPAPLRQSAPVGT
jgi:hypothetical protein